MSRKAGQVHFGAVVGVDDEVGSSGSVVFRVFEGAVLVYDSGRRTGSAAPVATVRLVVTDAGDGINYDHADWSNAALTCASSV